MSEWKLKKLGDLGIIKTGKTPSSKILGAFDLSGIPFITPKDMHNKKIVDNTERYLSPNGFEAVKNCVIPKNSVCVSCIGTVGLVVLTKESSITNQQINSLIVDENINNPDFLYYLLSSIKETIKLLASSGSVVPILNKTDFSKIQVKIPNKKTQDTISSYLKCLDDKITLNTQTNQTLEQIAQGIFKHWFIDFAPIHAKANALARGETTEQAELAAMACLSGKTVEKITALKTQDPTAYHQLQQTAAAFPSEFVETEMGEVPKGWEWLKIEQVIKKIPVGKKYSQKNTFPEGHIPVLDQGKSGIIGFHNDTAGVNASIQDPVIVFANHTCYMRLIHFDFSAIQNVFAFKGQNVNIYWLYLATLGKQKFVEYKGHFPDFLIKQIVVPPKELTEIFGNIVKDSFSKIALNLNTNEKLAKTRDLLLPRVLSGEIEL
ncbi:restriction endonuclease subunit S [Avibacterium paragallinarum]|uniref:Restriction endonuclease subunit S n=1 Tax=Avibacterium paragallinarum TaxID=728 RepID=A0ABU7QQP1_AVIPA|nr:restriction endonuclease subunit S [Avibacterium paragallinarum]